MKNRKFLTAGIAVMLSCALAACGGQTGTQQTTAATEAVTEETTVAAAETTTEAVSVAAAEETAAETTEAKTEVSGPITITDMLGREITLEQPAAQV